MTLSVMSMRELAKTASCTTRSNFSLSAIWLIAVPGGWGGKRRRASGQIRLFVACRQKDGRRRRGGRVRQVRQDRGLPPPELEGERQRDPDRRKERDESSERFRRDEVAGSGQPAAGRRKASRCVTSPLAGKRPASFLENRISPSRTTSKTPPRLLISVGCKPYFASISAARPAARGP